MARPRFSDMLLDRRRQLGLSIKQASNVLRLKEEVLVAFEEGDFESIPKSGYAQGMLSSYARYLGLNAKTVVNQFQTDLLEHERGAGSHEVRRRSRLNRTASDGPLYETPQAHAVGHTGTRQTYVESHGLLPTSGGLAGDLGDFATTSAARPRYGASRTSTDDDDYAQGRRYTSRVPSSGGSPSPLGQSQRQRPSARRGSYAVQQEQYGRTVGSSASDGYGYQDQVTTRRVMPTQYRDDMRLDNEGRTYQAASSTEGRRSSRNIASTERPNVRRRSGRASREQLRNRDQGPRHGGVLGMLEVFFSDRGRTIALIAVLLCLLLTGTIIFSVRSCVSARQSTGRVVSVTSTEADQKDDSSGESQDDSTKMTSEEEEKARADAAAAKAAEEEQTAVERIIEVTVADGAVTWLEIEHDGTSDIAETVTGPWSRTYTVRQALTINVNDTTAVTVTEGDKKLEFESRASGIGTITIQVAKKSDVDAAAGDDATASSDGEGTTQQDGGTSADQGTQQTGDGQSQTEGTYTEGDTYSQGYTSDQGSATGEVSFDGYTLDEDGYYYGSDGYLDAQGNFYSY